MSKWLNMVKEKHVDASVTESMDNLFKAFKDRTNALPGWSEDIPTWLKNANPDLYSKWTELEYTLDERWSMNDLEGFKAALSKYEAIQVQILKQWNERTQTGKASGGISNE